MSISFTILTSDPAALCQLLASNGIITVDAKDGSITPKAGVEFVIVPNPIEGDTRRVFLVKVAHRPARSTTSIG
jgi:hypothetical protein